jgi:hypothetical protein
VKLKTADLATVLRILEKIDAGLVSPRMPGRIGRFLRQYEQGRAQLGRILKQSAVEARADGAVSGRGLGMIGLRALLAPEVSLLGFPLGEVAGTIAVSEQLGGVVTVDMWLKGPIANKAYNLLRESAGLRLTGDYRWTPPTRLTPGEASLEPEEFAVGWQKARCLKAVADDILRPPHALEYVLDYRMGSPGLKYFCVVCAVRRADEWMVLPALTEHKMLRVATSTAWSHSNGRELCALLIYCEPWSRDWIVAAAAPISDEDALAHAISWADFRRELDGSELDPMTVSGIRESFEACGLTPIDLGQPNLTRSLLPVARDVVRWLRGCA